MTPRSIDFATSHGTATVISDRGSGVWLSTDSGAQWTPVTVPVDHGAQTSISGVSFDGVRAHRGPARHAPRAAPRDGVAYFSPDGRTWQYAGTIDAAGGWSPDGVKGSDYGFVVTGQHQQSQYVAYTSTGTGASGCRPGPLGARRTGRDFTAAVGPGGSVIAAGSTSSSTVSQQALLIKAAHGGRPCSRSR